MIHDNIKLYKSLGYNETECETACLVSIEIPPGQRSLKHHHPNMPELFYVLKGQVEIVINEKRLLYKLVML